MKLSNNNKLGIVLGGICFLVYNVSLFVLCGFDHSASFWISWGFMLIAFAAVGGTTLALGQRGMKMRDWLFGYPILRHSTIYAIAEFVLSTLFIILDDNIAPAIVFVIQFIVLGVHLVFAVSCFLAKNTIDELHTKIDDKVTYIKLLSVDAEMLCEKCNDPEAKKTFKAFAEQVRYSDIMSNEALFELEKDISLAVSDAGKLLDVSDVQGALVLCNKASLMLTERNKKCKALKK